MTEQALDEILSTFEDGTFPRFAWNHAAHLTVAGCYLCALDSEEAHNRMRSGVVHYNNSVGIVNGEDSGYHETLTRFWIEVARGFLANQPAGATRAQKVNALVDGYGSQRDLYKQYWSFDLVKSRPARAGWVPPDVKPMSASA